MNRLLVSASILGLSMALPATAATITDWNTDNVLVGATPLDGITGESVVYDQAVPPIGTASTSGKIVFTPPEASSPGIKVVNSAYPDTGGSSTLTLDGCIMASSTATCDSPFQSGKRIKQVVTGFDPVDLVFDIDDTSTTESVYQVFGRLINQTSKSLAGFSLELGFGVGNDFVQATAADGISFSTLFTAQPSGSGPVSTQFPFGLFGDADTNPNFLLDGFFADERTGFDTTVTTAKIESSAIYGPYSSIFGDWMSAGLEPQGLFWDFDQDPDTDALLMAWETAPGVWELRRQTGQTCDGIVCTEGQTLASYITGDLSYISGLLGTTDLFTGAIEDLANLNLNYAIALGDMTGQSSFTLRTTTYGTPAVPLPPALPMAAAGVFALGLLRRRR